MPAERDSVNLWKEFEAELEVRSEGRYALAPVRTADAEWLRRAEPSPEVEEALARVIDRHGSYFHHVIVQGKRCSTSADLLRTFGDALEFPSYYGMNWDALDECLRELLVISEGGLGSYYGDRPGRRERSLVLVVADAEHLLEQGSTRDYETLLRILRRVADGSPNLWGGDSPLGNLFVLFSLDPTAPPGARYHLSG